MAKPRKSIIWRQDELPEPFTVGEGRAAVHLRLLAHGRDLVLLVGGGEDHVGAAAVAAPGTPARAVVVPGHKEGALAQTGADRLAADAGCAVAVVAGIHQDGATGREIAAIIANVDAGVDRLAAGLARPRTGDDDS